MADARITELSKEMLSQVDQGTITLGFLEKSLATFADEIRRELPRGLKQND